MAKQKLLVAIVLTPILVVGIIFLILWLSLRPHKPRFHVQEFSIPGLGQPSGFENSRIAFNVTSRNSNRRVWIYYEALRGSVYYKDHRIVVKPILYSYYHEPKNTTALQEVFSGTMTESTVDSRRWMEFTNDRVKGTVMFNLRLTSDVKYRKSMWDTRKHRMRVKCEVGVGPDGSMLPYFRGKKCHVHLDHF